MICTIFQVFTLTIEFKKMTINKYLYPNYPVRCIITGPSECGKSVSPTNLILNFIILYYITIKDESTHLVFMKIYIKN